MTRLVAISAVAVCWLVALTAQLPAQQAMDPLRAAMVAMGAAGMESLRYVAFGATYTVGPAATRMPLPRYEGGIEMTPQGFLQAAAAHQAVARPVHLGVEISFVAGGRRHAGVLNERNQVDRVRTWTPDPVYGEMLVETFFRDYLRFGRVMFPTHITQDLARLRLGPGEHVGSASLEQCLIARTPCGRRKLDSFGQGLESSFLARRPALDLWVSSVDAHYNKEHR